VVVVDVIVEGVVEGVVGVFVDGVVDGVFVGVLRLDCVWEEEKVRMQGRPLLEYGANTALSVCDNK
jgi:hypothetical protein